MSVSVRWSKTLKGLNQRGSSFLDRPGEDVYGRPLTRTLLPFFNGSVRALPRLAAWTFWPRLACFLAMATSIFIASWAFKISSTAGTLLADLLTGLNIVFGTGRGGAGFHFVTPPLLWPGVNPLPFLAARYDTGPCLGHWAGRVFYFPC